MRVLIEEYQYKYEDVYGALKGLDVLQDVNGKVSLSYVGYFYNPDPDVQDCVFILPKVLLGQRTIIDEEGKQVIDTKSTYDWVFGHIAPRDLINMEKCEELRPNEYQFIYNLSVWIYRAICVFKEHEYDERRGKKKTDASIVLHKQAPMMGHSKKRKSNTFLDVLLALQQWNKDNESFVMFIVKNIHSGYNKINWTRTISRSSALLQSSTIGLGKQDVAYLNPVNKKKQVNFDEELLIIYFSILQYMKEAYGFPVKINVNFELIRGKKFERYINGYGKNRLKQIKYKYFSDKALELWDLCYAFFEHPYRINLNIDQKEYLLVKSFHVVFEAIIDDLIAGDQKLPKELLDQEDGKRVDHMYQWQELTNNNEEEADNIYYIGDSKYYKRGNQLGDESVYKQFTYAKNVIQWNWNLFNDDTEDNIAERPSHVKLRDDVTEGYNIIPNFFISANQDELVPKDDIHLAKDKKHQYYLSRQFENRLFDRDTFMLAHYDVNFLFVIALYGRDKQNAKVEWRRKVRNLFRKEIQEMLMKNFLFYAITPHEDVNPEMYIRENFQSLLGKVYKPFEDCGAQEYFSLALRNPKSIVNNDKLRNQIETENEGIRQVIDQYFYRAKCNLGINPSTLKELHKVTPKPSSYVPDEFRTRYFFEAFMNATFLVGCYKHVEHLQWIFGRYNKRDNMYNIRIDRNRDGSVSKHKAKKAPNFLIMYNLENPNSEVVMQFKIHNAADTPYAFMLKTKYPFDENAEPHNYVSYILEPEPITFGEIEIERLLQEYKATHPEFSKGEPIFMIGSDLIKYRRNKN